MLRLLAVLYLVLAVYVGVTTVQIPSPFELNVSDLVAAIAGLTACLIGAWLVFEIALAVKELSGY